MRSENYKEIEKRFFELKHQASDADWNDVEYLVKLAKDCEIESPMLSFRIMQRVHNLSPEETQINELLEKYRVKSNVHNQKQAKSKNGLVNNIDNQNKRTKQMNPSLDFIKNGRTVLENTVKKHSFICFVLLPCILFFIYSEWISTEKYESRAKLVVEQPDSLATLSPEMAILGGLGGTTGTTDGQLVEAYIYSLDMLQHLQSKLDLKSHYSKNNIDFFSRLDAEVSQEEFYEYYEKQIRVEVENDTGIINVYVVAFDSAFASALTKELLNKSEKFINQIGHNLAQAQLKFVKSEHNLAKENLKLAQRSLLNFQNEHGLLDPESEGAAMQTIAYTLESKIAEKNAELISLRAIMAPESAEIIQVENILEGLNKQLAEERQRLSENDLEDTSVSEIMATYSELKVSVEMALQSYSASLVSMEKSRVEAYRQIKYLVTVESPTTPETTKYPQVGYNLSLFTLLILLLFGVMRIVIATILELKK